MVFGTLCPRSEEQNLVTIGYRGARLRELNHIAGGRNIATVSADQAVQRSHCT